MIDELRQSNRAWFNHLFFLVKSAIKGLHPFSPVVLERLQPFVHLKQASRIDVVVPLAASSLVANQLGSPQHLQMFRNRRPVQSKLIDQVVDCVMAVRAGAPEFGGEPDSTELRKYQGSSSCRHLRRKFPTCQYRTRGDFEARIRGQVAFVQMIDPDQSRPLLAALAATSG